MSHARFLLCLFLAACAGPRVFPRDRVERLSLGEEPVKSPMVSRGSAPESAREDPWWQSFAARRYREPQAALSLPAEPNEDGEAEQRIGQDLRVLARLTEHEAPGAAEVFARALAEQEARRPLIGYAGSLAATLLPDLTLDDPEGPPASDAFFRGLITPVLGGEPTILERQRGRVVMVSTFKRALALADHWSALQAGNQGLKFEAEAYVLQVPPPEALPQSVRWARGIDFGGSKTFGWAPSNERVQALLDWSQDARGSRILAERAWTFSAGAESLRGWSSEGEQGHEGAGLGLRVLALPDGELRVEARLRLVQLDAVVPLFPRRFQESAQDDRPKAQPRLTGLRLDQAFDVPAGRWRWFPLGTLPGVEGSAGPRYGLLLRIRGAQGA